MTTATPQEGRLFAVSLTKLGRHTARVTPDGRLNAHDALRVLGLDEQAWPQVAARYDLGSGAYDFGTEAGAEPTLTYDQFAALAFLTDTPEAKRWRERSRELLARYLEGDVKLAAEIAERNPDSERRRWLSARLESVEARKRFMSTVARHGGEGTIFQQVSSLSNRSVLNMNSAAFRRERGVRDTRDGMTAAELMRLTYLETASAQAIEAHGARGNDQILELHRKNALNEKKVWESALGQAS